MDKSSLSSGISRCCGPREFVAQLMRHFHPLYRTHAASSSGTGLPRKNDLIKKPGLSASDITRIKRVAVELLARLKAEKLRIDHWREKEITRDAVRVTIHDYLWSDRTGLPVDFYTEEDVDERAEEVFRHVSGPIPLCRRHFTYQVPRLDKRCN